QERLAERARKLQDSLKRQGAAVAGRSGPDARSSGRGADATRANAQAQAAASEAAKEIDRQRLADRMQQSADAMRQAGEDPRGRRSNTAPPNPIIDQARGQ